jgi:hypothetical protein
VQAYLETIQDKETTLSALPINLSKKIRRTGGGRLFHQGHLHTGITVTGKAFYDIARAPADHSNRRAKPEGYAVWEIHSVMALHVDQ